ncbi:glycoside hydrolase family 2 protein [Streptomyces sp. NEAU-Y11]|uniref:glycoside hydrolase family 2 protein n=1 Tax=Streptomyces cucumeris TaxID=2962890 RepID=UPI0020C85C66|nr:glycoside hydrolase family 2 TIM barrel-domain containing protein [Streptomyces sp. NEAU-Y11]MCP9206737.1 glycoside hydrolase family 2 protein [Streptomyces sp. NEAU-Y11]
MPHPPSRRRVLGTMAGGSLIPFTGVATADARPAPPSAVGATYTAPRPRTRIDLNTGWRFTKSDPRGAQAPGFDDSGWAPVSTPHTWNAADGADGGGNYHRGTGWYRRHDRLPAGTAGKMLFLQFAGANQVAEVWVNGTYLGRHQGGYSRFRFDATRALRPGEDNVIAVRVSNAHDPDIAPLSGDFSFSGGIYRNVSLWTVDRLQVRMLDHAGPGVYLRPYEVTEASAKVAVTTKLWNNNSTARSVVVRTVITDADGTVVVDERSDARTVAARTGSEVTRHITIDEPRLWNGRPDPHLYRANVEIHDTTGADDVVTDVVTERFGLRGVSVDADTGFFLNGKHLGLHGVNLHQDRSRKGWAVDDADHVKDFDLIEEVGANAVRMAHYQHDQKDYDLADERGLVVWAEIPLVDSITESAAFTATTRNQLMELIRQNYNHPSIAFWGIGNEQRRDNGTTNALLDTLARIVETEDPERISTYAVAGGRDRELGKHTRTTGYNVYFGWYGGSKDGEMGRWADDLHTSAPDRRIAVSEYGAGANTAQHALNPARPESGGPFHPEEYQALYHEAAWKQLVSRPYIWGTFVWNMFDFASDRRNEGGQPGINDKGLVTRDRRIRKDAFYWYKANWAASPTLHITSRRWTRRHDASTELKVYSNSRQVAATLNGRSLGTRSSADHIFTWSGVTLAPGENEVAVTATIGGKVHTDTVIWTLVEDTPGGASQR